MAHTVVAGLPHHVTQRGDRREAIFFEDGDQEVYRDLLAEQQSRYGQFRKLLKVSGIECVDALHIVGLHRRDKLQVKNVSARYAVTLQQFHPSAHSPCRGREDMDTWQSQ
jgi:hypothetical protein